MKNQTDTGKVVRDGYVWTEQSCPICGRLPGKFVGQRGGSAHSAQLGVQSEIWACEECELVFPNPMPFPEGGLAQHYHVDADAYFQAHDKDLRSESALGLVRKAEELLGRKGKLLDVGVGRGEVLIAASEEGWECEGVEPSTTFADYAEKRTGARIWRQPIEESEVPDATYDIVILAAVLEHLYNPDIIIERISKALRPGGYLFLDVPNEAGLYFTIGNLYYRIRGRDWCVNLAPTFSPFHVFGFSPTSLRKILAKHGLKPVDFRVYPGTSLVPRRNGLIGRVENVASKAVTALSRFGEMGTYIETWARKEE